MNLTRVFLVLAMIVLNSAAAFAQGYPNRPVRIVVPYPAGQGTDIVARYIANALGPALGQNVYIENKGGAAGNIGTAEAARAPADGYTLLMGTNGTHVLNQFLYTSIGFNPAQDFEPIILLSTFPMAILANANSNYRTIKDILDKSTPGSKEADIALPSTTARLVFELLKENTKVELFKIPYRGSNAATTDVIGGQVPILIDTVSAAKSLVESGKLRPIAVTSLNPTALMPDAVPVSKQGFANFEVVAWTALYAPRGTPQDVVMRINAEVGKILSDEAVRRRLIELGHEPAGGTAEKLTGFAASERTKWSPLIERAGIKAE